MAVAVVAFGGGFGVVEAGSQLVDEPRDRAEVLLDAGEVSVRRRVGHLVVDLDLGDDGTGELLVGRRHEEGPAGAQAFSGPAHHHGDVGRLEAVTQDLGFEAEPLAQLDQAVGFGITVALHWKTSLRRGPGTMAR